MTGAVKLIKMPAVLNPLDDKASNQELPPGSRDSAPAKLAGARNVPERSSADMGSMGSLGVTSEQENNIILKNDIEKFSFEELTLDAVLIDTIAAKKKSDFVDPFALDEEKKDEAETPAPEVSKPVAQQQKGKNAAVANEPVEPEVDDGSFKYRLGKKQYRDTEQGDMGCLYKRPEVMPHLFFIRASFAGKLNSQMPHEELKHIGKSLKQFYITTGLGIAYLNDFSLEIYNIQKPCRENVV